MKKRNALILIAAVLICIAIVLIIVLSGDDETPPAAAASFDPSITVTDNSALGLTLLSLDTIAGVYVEDGSDTPSDGIFTAVFRNDAGSTLQLANIVLTINGTEYHFQVSTLPAGESVRAMESGKQTAPESFESCVMSTENIAWFDSEPSLCESTFEIEQRDNALIVTNISDETVTAPIYLYYKNYDGEMYIGGITYSVSVQEDLAPGESVALPAGHFYTQSSKLMFVYAPYDT